MENAPATAFDPLPAVVAHADWSLHPKGRWVARALLQADGTYGAGPPEPVGPLEAYFSRHTTLAEPSGRVLLGFDFPFGLPRRFAERAGIGDFSAFLHDLREGRWPDFFRVAEEPEQISLRRPFYPQRNKAKGQIRLDHLLTGLGLAERRDLRRACDQATPYRQAAAPLFWTMGAQQVGKAAMAGWRDLFLPALLGDRAIKLWPFDGPLAKLLAEPGLVIAETYPGEIYHHLGLTFSEGGKRSQAARRGCAVVLLSHAKALGLRLEPGYRALIEDGFGAAPSGEDPFDATVGLFGMINVLRGRRPPGDPVDPIVRQIEGWILGQSPAQQIRND